jgi:hypothetical protein
MSNQQEVFGRCLKIFEFFALDKIRKKTFIRFFAPLLLRLIIFAIAYNVKTVNEKMKLIQVIAIVSMTNFKAINVLFKFKEIKSLIGDVEKLISEIDDEKILKDLQKEKMRILIYFIMNFALFLIGQIVALVVKQSMVPLWTPDVLSDYKLAIFLVYWIMNTFCSLYTASLSFTMDFLAIFLLTCMKAYSKFLCKSFDKHSGSEKTKITEENLIRRLQKFHEFKM